MPNDEVLNTDLIRNRILQLEYDDLYVGKIKEIFIEETGKEPPTNIEIYSSKDYINNSEANGFNGTVIHFYDEKQGINQAYTITRGSEFHENHTWRPEDWSYNLMGIFVGSGTSQYNAAIEFDNQITKIISNKTNSEVDLKKIGLGHSLGGNLNTLIQLNTGRYETVYTTNPAPPTFYQLYNIDYEFKVKVDKEFKINSFNSLSIYHLDPSALKEFAEEYYKDRGKNIHHTIAEQDILYTVRDVRGFFEVGTTTKIDVLPNKDVANLKSLIDEIPDEIVRDIQIYLAKNYSNAYNSDGFDGLLAELTGFDAGVIDRYQNGESLVLLIYDTLKMLPKIKERIPKLINYVQLLSSHLPPILNTFQEYGYITENEKLNILIEIESIERDLIYILDTVNFMLSLSLSELPELIVRLYILFNKFDNLEQSFNKINENSQGMQTIFKDATNAHSLNYVINALGLQENKRYVSGDLIYSATIDGEKIDVNISSASRIYVWGMHLVEEQRAVLKQMKHLYEMEYIHDFNRRKKNLLEKIYDMESRPYAYQYLLGKFTYDTKLFYRLTKIVVHDSIKPLPYHGFRANFENMFQYIETDINKTEETLTTIKKSIEQLFEEEEKIANTIF